MRYLAAAVIPLTLFLGVAAAFDTIGNGYGSKWGDAPEAGNGAVVTWGFMLDGTDLDPDFRLDPFAFPDISGMVGTSNITALRSAVDTDYGAGSFDAAIQSAFDTWSAVANITFVGPLADSGQDVGSEGATSPMIRIGAFAPDPTHWFKDAGAVGFGPPGPSGPDFFPLSGDILFNLDGIGMQTPFQIAPGVEDMTVVDVYNYGDDVEGLFLHELGHAAIGLNHPSWDGENPDQRVMYVGDFENEDAPFCCQSLNRELHPDDIAGAQFVYGLRGDYNRDGSVDAGDYPMLRDTLGQSVINGTAADGNVDGMIDEADVLVWREHFGETAAVGTGVDLAAGSTVPEPSSLVLFLLTAVCMVAGRGWIRKGPKQFGADSAG